MKNTRSYRHGFILFSLYNLAFLIFQLAIIGVNTRPFVHALSFPGFVYVELITTLLTHLTLYLLLSALQTLLFWGITQWHRGFVAAERWHRIIWAGSVGTLLLSNAYFFPRSHFSTIIVLALPPQLLIILLQLFLLFMGLLILNLLFFVLKRYPKISMGLSLIVLGLFVYGELSITPNQYIAKTKKPNIIVIGIDSLNLNYINANDMPTLARFIQDGVLFKETITPLARTYPSWTSILTGLYPEHHHVHYNLMPSDGIKSSSSIAYTLQQLGYQTLFATDDRQFSNLGKEFGFQTIVGPKVGALDLLLASLNDFPLSNLLINLPISQWLFPYNYINRASYFSYYPDTFDKALQRALLVNQPSAPHFIAVHFTLPHWPFIWARTPFEQMNGLDEAHKKARLYQLTLQQVDQQVAHLLSFLKRNGYLENTMVVLLSDHGETLTLPGSRQTNADNYQGPGKSHFVNYLQRKTATPLNISTGHGSDLLSPDQYHCLLAFKIYQKSQLVTAPKIINTRVALIDIVPTLLAFLSLPSSNLDGISLLNTLVKNEKPPERRIFVMESGMFPNQALSMEQLTLIARKFFTIEPKQAKLQLRRDQLVTLDRIKLYAVIDGNWILALYPDDNGYIPIIQRLSDGKWTDELSTNFAKKSPALSLLEHLDRFYNKTRPLSLPETGGSE